MSDLAIFTAGKPTQAALELAQYMARHPAARAAYQATWGVAWESTDLALALAPYISQTLSTERARRALNVTAR